MADLVRWLGQQLDTDERKVRTIPVDLGHSWSDPGPWVMAGGGGGGREAEVAKAAEGLEMPLAEVVAHHIAAWDPARVLREIDSKRRIIDAYETTVRAVVDLRAARERLSIKGHDTLMTDLDLESAIHKRDALQGVLRLLALPYDDRPGFQESWRP